jgi:hypothetical protein
LPTEYAERAFLLGAKYQRTEHFNSEQAIASVQQLADTIVPLKRLGLSYEIRCASSFCATNSAPWSENADVARGC